jgi:hypothetical protein
MIVIAILALLILVALALQIASVIGAREVERVEKERVEREVHRAEYRLHQMASDAFAALLDASRSEHRDDEPS